MKIAMYSSRTMFDDRLFCRTKSPIFATILLAAIFFIISTNNIISNVFIYSDAFLSTQESHQLQIGTPINYSTRRIPLRAMQEEIKVPDNDVHNDLIPPFNVTAEKRIAWFQQKLPKFQIFNSDPLTAQQFHGRILEFFNNNCESQFFMTWIAEARLFGKKDFLSMESLFKVHPRGCLIIVSVTMDSVHGYRILKPLIDRGFKVTAITPDLQFLFKNTPAEGWYDQMKSGKMDPGEIPLPQNLSNLIRLAVLYRYGGTYLDTDFIIVNKFTGLRNSIGAQSIDMVSKNWTRLNTAVLVFDMNHPLLLKFIEEFALTFDGNKWGHNGPYLITRVVKRVQGRTGYNFTILPPSAFYPVIWTKITEFFKKPGTEEESRWVEAKLLQLRKEAYGIHLWNKQSRKAIIEEGSVMGKLMSNKCVICEYTYSS